MQITKQIATHLRQVHKGGNWTSVNFEQAIAGLSKQHATEKYNGFNTIAALVFHMNYYVRAQIRVLEGKALDAHDKFSFDLPPLQSEQDWHDLVQQAIADAEKLANLIESYPDEKLSEHFIEEKYGTYFRNFMGLIEHCHYHLGQIVIIKKLVIEQHPAPVSH